MFLRYFFLDLLVLCAFIFKDLFFLNKVNIIFRGGMLKKKLWIMDNKTFDSFEKYRAQRYKASQIKAQVNDSMVIKHYTAFIIHFFRKRKISKQDPFSTQKLIHTAVCLYKRYYLVNIYGQAPLLQDVVCSIYLSLKMNQIPLEQIAKLSTTWKNKKQPIFPEECIHFKELGYNERELSFLRGIGFQIGRSPLVPAVESLFVAIKQKITNQDLVKEIFQLILEMIRRVYLDERAIFLFEGPKIGLAIVLYALQEKEKQEKLNISIEELLGNDIFALIERYKIQVEGIVEYISKLQKIEQKIISEAAKQLKQKVLKCNQRTYEMPLKKSPKISPVNYQFKEQEGQI